MTQDVDPRVFQQAGDTFVSIHNQAASAITQLAGILKGSAGMAGTDDAAHKWASKYDLLCGGREGANGVMEEASLSTIGAGQVADLLHATAVNHGNADQASAVNAPNAPAFPPWTVPIFSVPNIPSAEGGHDDVPEWWHTVSAYVEGQLWPNGHQDQLKAAATAWRAAASALRRAASDVNGGPSALGVIAPLMDQKSPEVPAVIANIQQARDAINSSADGCDIAASACDAYAAAIDQAHSDILNEMAILGATVAVTEVIAAVLIPITAGISEAVSKVVDVSRLVATGARIAEIIRGFVAAAELSAFPTVAAGATAARTIAELGPLLEARTLLFTSEATGIVNPLTATEMYSRPRPRVATRDAVEKAARKTPDGKYYVSATDDHVLVPVSKEYDQDILNLPKTTDGHYYVGADGFKYPVDPVYQLGHKYGRELPILQREAMERDPPMTRQEFLDYINNPAWYRIEDAPGNASHRFEAPRERP
jgi:hypothetical protein